MITKKIVFDNFYVRILILKNVIFVKKIKNK